MEMLNLTIGSFCRIQFIDTDTEAREYRGILWPKSTQLKLAEVALSSSMIYLFKKKNNNFPGGHIVEIEQIADKNLHKANICYVTILRDTDTLQISEVNY